MLQSQVKIYGLLQEHHTETRKPGLNGQVCAQKLSSDFNLYALVSSQLLLLGFNSNCISIIDAARSKGAIDSSVILLHVCSSLLLLFAPIFCHFAVISPMGENTSQSNERAGSICHLMSRPGCFSLLKVGIFHILGKNGEHLQKKKSLGIFCALLHYV